MSTRGLFTFKGAEDYEQDWNVYKHSDCYPTGAAETLVAAQEWFAWKAPRYESDEFAAAFCAAGKAWYLISGRVLDPTNTKYHPGGDYRSFSGGGVRLMPQGDPTEVAKKNCSDIEYRYEIYERVIKNKKELWIKAFSGNWWDSEANPQPIKETEIINCRLTDFPTMAKSYEKVKRSA